MWHLKIVFNNGDYTNLLGDKEAFGAVMNAWQDWSASFSESDTDVVQVNGFADTYDRSPCFAMIRLDHVKAMYLSKGEC